MDKLLSRVLEFQNKDDLNLRNDFLEQYKPLIVNTVSKVTGRYVQSEESDEYAVGLEAFNEAINKYAPEKGSFIAFARLVMRSRVTDYLRKESHYLGLVEPNEEILMNAHCKVDEDLLTELAVFRQVLSSFGITMDMLVDGAPKHHKTKEEIISLSQDIAGNDPITKRLYDTKKLPMAAIMKSYKSSKKRLKVYRNYIIGVVIIVKEELEIMQTYLGTRGD